MDKKTALNILVQFKAQLERKGIRIKSLVLFGSCVADTCREGSDIDVVVISEDFTGKGYWERIDILSDAICEVFQPIEAIAMTPHEWESEQSLIAGYARSGEVLFAQ